MARVLFVDDDPFTLETLTKAVQMFGHQALIASSGQQALDLTDKELPDLIFIDMMLPDMDGISLVEAFRRQPTLLNIPILMLSAGPELDTSARATAAGAQAYLNKPIRLQTLLDIIEKNTTKQAPQ